jgi:hypothetical protein
MNVLSTLAAVATLVAIGASVSPAAAQSGSTPMCSWSGDHEMMSTDDFLQWLPFEKRSMRAQADVWNGCFRVTYVVDGKYVTEIYDPETMRQVG